jgi:hypothetical protein
MLDPNLTSVASLGALRDAYHRELTRAAGLHVLTRGATLVGDPFARDASPYSAHQVAAPNVLLVGDAASFVDPLSSFGIKKALASAWLAAVVAHTCLEDASMVRSALELFESRERAMYDALERRRVELAQAALSADATSAFWMTRAQADVHGVEPGAVGSAPGSEPNEEVDVELLRVDAAVQGAFAELKRRESITLVPGGGLEYALQAAVVGNRVMREKRLRIAARDRGGGEARAIRYLRNVDLVALVELAPGASQVPDLYESYCRRIAPVPLPDFLGALAFLIGRRILEFA